MLYGKIQKSTISKEKSEFCVGYRRNFKVYAEYLKRNNKLMTILQEKVVINIFL